MHTGVDAGIINSELERSVLLSSITRVEAAHGICCLQLKVNDQSLLIHSASNIVFKLRSILKWLYELL